MTALALTLTAEGIAAAVNAANTGTGPIVLSQIALLSGPTTEIKRIATLGGDSVADNIIHVTITDETADTYTLRGLRLITDGGVIFANYSQATPILEKGAEQLVMLSADIVLTSVPAGSVTIGGTAFQYPPATTTRQGVIEIATDAEAQTGTDTTRAITPAGLQSIAAATAPAMNGAAAIGTAKRWARADHVHPSDTAKANTSGTYAGLNVGYATSAGNADTLDGWHADNLRAWGNLTGRPTTIAGYGITDAIVLNNGGTYGINVSGSSAYAQNAGNADTLDGWHRDDIRQWWNLLNIPALVYNNGDTYGIHITGNCNWASGAGNADTVDGYHAYQLLRADQIAFSAAAIGYRMEPPDINGRRLIFQWGYFNAGDGDRNITFPLAFPNACFGVFESVKGGSEWPEVSKRYIFNVSQWGFTASFGGIGLHEGKWFALGY